MAVSENNEKNTIEEQNISPTDNAKKARFAALPQRIISAIILVIIVGGTLYLGGNYYLFLAGLAAVILLHEWMSITKNFNAKIVWYLFGIIYISVGCAALASLILLDVESYNSKINLIYLLAVVAATDIGAYFSGKFIGGKKLAPSISPGKTWAGLMGGMIFAAAASFSLSPYVPFPSAYAVSAAIMGLIIALLAQTGDLFESWLKRKAGVKDSGKIIPGHGGLFDRLDGFMLTAPLYLYLLIIFTENL